MTVFKSYGFTLPGGLPKVWYDKLKDLVEGLSLTQRQVIILGLAAICELGKQDPALVDQMAQTIRGRYLKHPKKGESDESTDGSMVPGV